MNDRNWPYRWFGVWKEYGKGYEAYPSILDFVDEGLNGTYDRSRLVKYIRSGYALATTSRRYYPHPLTGVIKMGSICYRTDGVWLWLDDLAEYIEKNNVVIPQAWYAHVQSNQFIIPVLGGAVSGSLDWPKYTTA